MGQLKRSPIAFWIRAIALWLLLMAAEVVHGVARATFLVPLVGDFRARQIAVFSGACLILSITCLTIRWLRADTSRALVALGGAWVALTVAFEIGLGRLVLDVPWSRLASDYNLLRGGLMPVGLTVMAMSPLMAARLRGVFAGRDIRRGASLVR